MKCFAVIDTNILVSALLSKNEDAATVQVLSKMFLSAFTSLFSDEILSEYSQVLKRKKFHFSEHLVNQLINAIEKTGQKVYPAFTGEVLPDMKDLPFYEVVMEKQHEGAYLVTGNMKHFPSKHFIVTPREFINILNS